MKDKIREIILVHAKLGVAPTELTDDYNLYDAGMSSHASVHLMLALEDEFQVEFPDSLLNRDVFRSVSSITGAVEQLTSA